MAVGQTWAQRFAFLGNKDVGMGPSDLSNTICHYLLTHDLLNGVKPGLSSVSDWGTQDPLSIYTKTSHVGLHCEFSLIVLEQISMRHFPSMLLRYLINK